MENEEKVETKENVTVKDLIPVEKIKELVAQTTNTAENSVTDKLDSDFDTFIKSDNEEVKKASEKHNKKTLKLFTKRKEGIDDNISATKKYATDYEREEWYYKRHKDTIDKYIKKDDKDKKRKKDDNAVEVVIENENNQDDTLRVGLFKMWSIVFYDMLIFILGCIVFSPVHLVRYVAELFFKMRKSLAITVGIIVGVVVLVIGLYFGISALFNYARSVS